MREFKTLKPAGLPREFDVAAQSESPIVKVEESETQIVVSYVFPGFYLVDDAANVDGKKVEFKRPHISTVGFLAQSGKPLLPSFGRYVQIPDNCTYDYNVKKEQTVEFDGVFIAPAQEKLYDTVGQQPHVFEYDKTFYEKDEFYPKEVVELRGPLKVEGYSALLLSVRPLQYNPAKKKLVGYGNITVTINITPKRMGESQLPKDADAPPMEAKAVGSLFLNPVLVAKAGAWIVGPIVRYLGPRFLIIYNDAFKAAADKLALWKKKCGLTTSTVAISTIGNDVQKIKDYIRARRLPIGGLRYVLLLGDRDTIVSQSYPPWIAGYIAKRYTDFYYSTDSDKEDLPAGAPGYLFPQIAIGRIPAATLAQALGIVDKIIAYEKQPPTAPDYFNHITLAAYFQDDIRCNTCWTTYNPPQPAQCPRCGGSSFTPQDGQEDRAFVETIQHIHDFFAADPKYNLERIYVSNNNGNENVYHDGTAIPASVKACFISSESTATTTMKTAVANGRHFVGHRDHGGVSGWGHPPFTTSDLSSVSSIAPSILYSINCLTGAFGESVDCFAEAILKMSGGAPSLIAASDLSNTWLNNDLIYGLFDATFGGMLPAFPGMAESYPVSNNRIGDILNYAKHYLPIARAGGATDDDIVIDFEEYHVIGDPTLEIWTDRPKKIRLAAILRLNVLYITMSECPPGSKITIWKGKTLLKTMSPSSTRFSVSTRGVRTLGREGFWPPLNDIVVCFKAPGYRFASVRAIIR